MAFCVPHRYSCVNVHDCYVNTEPLNMHYCVIIIFIVLC